MAGNRQVLLKSHPQGVPVPDNFEIVDGDVPAVGDGQVLSRTLWLSLDPYMRSRMMPGGSGYAAGVGLGHVMVGGTVGQVIESRAPGFTPGDFVLGYGGWQELAVEPAGQIRKLDPTVAPLSAWLGVLGMPGLTAYVGLLDVGQPRPGETVVVSAAAGAVGSVVGQIAKLKGCRAVGVAGSDDKCKHVVEQLGLDACVNYRTQLRAIKRACPDGIDVYFDCVGGDVLTMVLRFINLGARIPLIGLISQYNATEMPTGPNLVPLLVKRAMIRGVLVSDHADREPAFVADMLGWLASGQVRYHETIIEGLAAAPEAFIGLFSGCNLGKLVVKVASP